MQWVILVSVYHKSVFLLLRYNLEIKYTVLWEEINIFWLIYPRKDQPKDSVVTLMNTGSTEVNEN